MSITMRGGEQPFLDLPPVGEHGRHRTGRRRAAGYRDVLAIPEFRTLWGAQVLSYLGDQIAQVAIAVLVYAKTGSPLISALGAGWLATDWIRHRAAFAGLAAGSGGSPPGDRTRQPADRAGQ